LKRTLDQRSEESKKGRKEGRKEERKEGRKRGSSTKVVVVVLVWSSSLSVQYEVYSSG